MARLCQQGRKESSPFAPRLFYLITRHAEVDYSQGCAYS
nr:MAG TPA: hypothetical protein [Caudoviricetes sp.]